VDSTTAEQDHGGCLHLVVDLFVVIEVAVEYFQQCLNLGLLLNVLLDEVDTTVHCLLLHLLFIFATLSNQHSDAFQNVCLGNLLQKHFDEVDEEQETVFLLGDLGEGLVEESRDQLGLASDVGEQNVEPLLPVLSVVD